MTTAADAEQDLNQASEIFTVAEEEDPADKALGKDIPGLTEAQSAAVDRLLQSHAAAFSASASDPLRTSLPRTGSF